MVGPEGGFTGEEVKLAKKKGFIPVKLGQRILRTETAAITMVGNSPVRIRRPELINNINEVLN